MFKIFDKTKDEEKVRYLRLVGSSPGFKTKVNLVVVDQAGEIVPGGYILYISADGKIKRYDGVGVDVGFKLESHGYGKVTVE